jgi:hypothetical protein
VFVNNPLKDEQDSETDSVKSGYSSKDPDPEHWPRVLSIWLWQPLTSSFRLTCADRRVLVPCTRYTSAYVTHLFPGEVLVPPLQVGVVESGIHPIVADV